MERAGANQNSTASTSAPSWSHVVRGNIQSQTGANSNSNSNCEDQVLVLGQGIGHNDDMGRLQSQSPSTSESPSGEGELEFRSESEAWPALGQAPARPPTTSASASNTFPIPSSEIQDKRASDEDGNIVSNKVAVSQGSERDGHVPPGRNAPNRPFFSQGSETNVYVPPGRNSTNRPFFSQGSETNRRWNTPNRPLFIHGRKTNGYIPQGMNVPNRPFFSPNTNIAHSTYQHYRGYGYPSRGSHGNMHEQRDCPPRGGYWNMHNNMHDQTEYNYNWNSQQDFHGVNNVAMYQQFGPMNNLRQPPVPQLPVVNGATNQFYMNGAPMPPYYFPLPMYLDASSVEPYFMPPLPPVPTISQDNADLRKRIVKQVDFYFSSDNLCKDTYLRRQMDECGWVAISVVAGFKKMRQLTYDVNFILDALRDSTVVELQGDKIRRRNDWFHWPNPDFIIGVKKEGHMDGSSSSETTSDLGTSERVFPEKDILDDVLNPKRDDKVFV